LGSNHRSLKTGQGGGRAPNWEVGKFGGALDFDGKSSYVDCGNNAALKPVSTVQMFAWSHKNSWWGEPHPTRLVGIIIVGRGLPRRNNLLGVGEYEKARSAEGGGAFYPGAPWVAWVVSTRTRFRPVRLAS
jgi:hypothetical protein